MLIEREAHAGLKLKDVMTRGAVGVEGASSDVKTTHSHLNRIGADAGDIAGSAPSAGDFARVTTAEESPAHPR